MKTCFFTILQGNYASCIEYALFEKSFKHFHPDIPLFVVGDKEIQELMNENPSLDLYKIKATAAKLFYDEYDLVVNIDADHFIFSRLDEILKGDFDVATPSNFNTYENVSLNIQSYKGNVYNIIPELNYAQAGIVASTSKTFWKSYEKASLKHANHMTCRDNDVLNLVLEFGDYNFKLLDGGWDIVDPNRHSFYGCSSLMLEKTCVLENDIPCINGKPLKCYHVARGSAKPKFNELFNEDIVNWLHERLQ
jgi:hypothetical protein